MEQNGENKEGNIGVVLPIYNHVRFLERSIPPILKSERLIGQLLIIDDGSSDGSLEKARELTSGFAQVEIIAKGKNRGIYDTHRIAMEKIRTPFVYWAGADDWILDGFFEKTLSLLKKNPEARLCASDCLLYLEKEGRFVEQKGDWMGNAGMISKEEFARLAREREEVRIACSSVVVRFDALKEVGGFHEPMRWHCDWFSFTTIALRYGMGVIPEALTVFRLANGAYSSWGPSQQSERPKLARYFLKTIKSPSFQDIRMLWKEPSLLNPGHGGRWCFLKQCLASPGHWWFFSGKLFRACLRDLLRRPLWDLLWFFISPLSSRNFNRMKLKLLRLFGAKIEGAPVIGPFVKIDSPWLLSIGDGVLISQGVGIWGKSPIEICSGVVIDRGAMLASSGWKKEGEWSVFRSAPVRIEKKTVIETGNTIRSTR